MSRVLGREEPEASEVIATVLAREGVELALGCKAEKVESNGSGGLWLHLEGGRVVDEGGISPGEYVTGWIKRGPSGVIGTNKKDSQDTVAKVIEDSKAGKLPEPAKEDIDALIAQAPHAVDWQGWAAIDQLEREAGEPQGRPRVKLVDWDELRQAARRGATASSRR